MELREDDLVRILQEGATIPLKLRGELMDARRKPDRTLVTAADLALDTFLKSELKTLLPTAGWLSEETADNPSRLIQPWVWVVDPIDGTKEFVAGIPECAISIGLVFEGKPVAGGIINPFTNEFGAWVKGRRPVFSGFAKSPDPAHSHCTSLSRTEWEEGVLKPYLESIGPHRVLGSVAYKLLRVAAGLEDLAFSCRPKSEWDICGGVALLHSVGKEYFRLDGQPLVFNQKIPRIDSGAVAGVKERVIALVQGINSLKAP